jgi:hypothetical protein
MTADETTVAKLDELLAAIRKFDDPRRAMGQWKQVFKLLQKAGLPVERITGVVGMRDVNRLGDMIAQLRAPADAPPVDADAPDADTLRKALAAFRKRSALTRLDEESRLGRSPLTKGPNQGAAAITPPAEWPAAVWDALVRQDKLRYLGHGMYELNK